MRPLISCVWVQGNVPYGAEYVRRLKSMVERHAGTEHDFVCLTDRPKLLRSSNIATIEIPTPPSGVFGWWSKLWVFSPYNPLFTAGRRCVNLDLDIVILDSLLPIIEYKGVFAIVPDDAPNFHGKGSRVTVKKYNSSVMVWNGGEQSDLFTEFNYGVTKRLWGDQDWIGERRPHSVGLMPLEWFPRLSQCEEERPPSEAKVLLCKKPKPELAVTRYPWVREAWV
jgi:hypothetical protein